MKCVKIQIVEDSVVIEETVTVNPPQANLLQDIEQSVLSHAMRAHNGNQSAAARWLGLSRYALRYRLAKFGMMKVGT
jgi:DNA-binding protein Fis